MDQHAYSCLSVKEKNPIKGNQHAKKQNKNNKSADEPVSVETDTTTPDLTESLEVMTDKWKRALTEAENAHKRGDAARLDGREHGVALAVEALVPVYDDICMGVQVALASPMPTIL